MTPEERILAVDEIAERRRQLVELCVHHLYVQGVSIIEGVAAEVKTFADAAESSGDTVSAAAFDRVLYLLVDQAVTVGL